MYDDSIKATIKAEAALAAAEAAAFRLLKRLDDDGDPDEQRCAKAIYSTLRSCRALCGATVGTLLSASGPRFDVEVKRVIVAKPSTPPEA